MHLSAANGSQIIKRLHEIRDHNKNYKLNNHLMLSMLLWRSQVRIPTWDSNRTLEYGQWSYFVAQI